LKKVISFALWGSNPMYLRGAVENAKIAPKVYPGWTLRYYTDERLMDTAGQELRDLGAETVEKPACDDYMGLYWRFEVVGDDGVDRFIIRDTDSRLNERESAAVKAWEASGRPFHLMRDHQVYHNVPIMGGMWGAVKGFMPSFMEEMAKWVGEEAPSRKRGDKDFWGSDQVFLKLKVWPVICDNFLGHDDCRRSPGRGDQRFGRPLPGKQFVGQQFDANNKAIVP